MGTPGAAAGGHRRYNSSSSMGSGQAPPVAAQKARIPIRKNPCGGRDLAGHSWAMQQLSSSSQQSTRQALGITERSPTAKSETTNMQGPAQGYPEAEMFTC